MIELTIYNFLKEKTNIPVYMEIPNLQKIDKFYTIEKTGSSKTNHIQESTFALQSWGNSMIDVIRLNEEIKALIESAIILNEIVSVRINSDYNYTETSLKKYRYQAVVDIVHY